jgi:hypothetical protein
LGHTCQAAATESSVLADVPLVRTAVLHGQ